MGDSDHVINFLDVGGLGDESWSLQRAGAMIRGWVTMIRRRWTMIRHRLTSGGVG